MVHDLTRLINAYKRYPSVLALSGATGIGYKKLIMVLDSAGVLVKGQGGRHRSAAKIETILAMRREGLSCAEIGKKLGLTKQGVHYHLWYCSGAASPAWRRSRWRHSGTVRVSGSTASRTGIGSAGPVASSRSAKSSWACRG